MAMTAAEKQRAYRLRKRELRRLAGTLRAVGRPKRELPFEWGTVTHRMHTWVATIHNVLSEEGVTEIGFREFRRRMNLSATKSGMLSADEVAGLLHRLKRDHYFAWDEVSRAGYPRMITVLPAPKE